MDEIDGGPPTPRDIAATLLQAGQVNKAAFGVLMPVAFLLDGDMAKLRRLYRAAEEEALGRKYIVEINENPGHLGFVVFGGHLDTDAQQQAFCASVRALVAEHAPAAVGMMTDVTVFDVAGDGAPEPLPGGGWRIPHGQIQGEPQSQLLFTYEAAGETSQLFVVPYTVTKDGIEFDGMRQEQTKTPIGVFVNFYPAH